MENILEINGLTKIYPAFELKPTSFHIEAGEVMGFIGRNGAGKTTTLKSILNLVHPDAGSVRILGMDYLDNEDNIKQQIGYAVGGINYYTRKKLKEIVAITRGFYDTWDDKEYRHYLTAFNLDENKKIMELSEGMKVKFYLTLALSHQAKLLILDEPTSGLDPVSRDEMNEIFRKLAQKGVAILFSTHITSDLEKCADTITYIKNGEILLSTKKEDFIQYYATEMGGSPTLEDIMVHIEREEVNL
ncbi:putative ABC transporter ATP-binding protein [Streptococcus anginosus]|uniref:ABC transporter ATP-binding protein n=2 Tax=Streptococcus anginosus TaxID=1328 RepID=A0AAP6BQT8_STRAP|nr:MULTISPECIES: ABC transporter ATP-binding protein [Streptococcus]ALL03762.1 ABC transporter, ATP-binding protein [Streptococcus anginosus]MCW0997871.1 ABC transporter ATP-binding protein [Streptococcus anginosus]MCW1035217.1 ABC transporter ATP-binding protein [Streptococcus anginosus]MCW1051793.1 ABC transporter ATP-binding protein [Streptococcus anginosus]MDU6601135.1 ABC transporter ATP-binding protein [Streptococcus anginosus]